MSGGSSGSAVGSSTSSTCYNCTHKLIPPLVLHFNNSHMAQKCLLDGGSQPFSTHISFISLSFDLISGRTLLLLLLLLHPLTPRPPITSILALKQALVQHGVLCAAILREVAVRSLRKAWSHCDSELQNVPWCISALPPG